MQLPFRVMLITDWSRGSPVERLARAVGDRNDLAVQHRHPGASDRQYFDEAGQLAQACAALGLPLFINGRLDVALALGAHLHLPGHGLSIADVRPFLPLRWISTVVHGEADLAQTTDADLALVSPVFAPRSKPTDVRPPLGPAGFRALAERLPCPAFALGGLDEARAATFAPSGYATMTW